MSSATPFISKVENILVLAEYLYYRITSTKTHSNDSISTYKVEDQSMIISQIVTVDTSISVHTETVFQPLVLQIHSIHKWFSLNIFWGPHTHTHQPALVLKALQASECLLIKPVGQLPLHLLNLTGAGVVSQRSCHFLVSHGLAVTLPSPPQLSEVLFILGGELKRAVGQLDPPDTTAHGGGLEHLKQELEQTLLPLSCHRGRGYTDTTLQT